MDTRSPYRLCIVIFSQYASGPRYFFLLTCAVSFLSWFSQNPTHSLSAHEKHSCPPSSDGSLYSTKFSFEMFSMFPSFRHISHHPSPRVPIVSIHCIKMTQTAFCSSLQAACLIYPSQCLFYTWFLSPDFYHSTDNFSQSYLLCTCGKYVHVSLYTDMLSGITRKTIDKLLPVSFPCSL